MMHFPITNETANVANITSMARERFGIENLVLANNSGCLIEDTEVTRGVY